MTKEARFNSCRARDVSLQDWLWGPPSIIFSVYCGVSPGAKESGHEADHSVASNAKFMNEWSYIFASTCVFIVCTKAALLVHLWTTILCSFHHLPDVTVCSHTSSRYCILPWWRINSFMVICDLGCWGHEYQF
jgi:hypothetical protein